MNGTLVSQKGTRGVDPHVSVRIKQVDSYPIEQYWNVFLGVRSDHEKAGHQITRIVLNHMPPYSTIMMNTGDLVVRVAASEFTMSSNLTKTVIGLLSPVHVLMSEMEIMAPHVAFKKVWDSLNTVLSGWMEHIKVSVNDGCVDQSRSLEQITGRHERLIKQLSDSPEWCEEAVHIFGLERHQTDEAIARTELALHTIAGHYCPIMFGGVKPVPVAV